MKLLQHKKSLLLTFDILLIPGILFFRWLSSWMLTTDTLCSWVALGGQCVSCGGTHFVNAILSGDFSAAWQHNAFLFFVTVLAILVLVLLHLHIFLHLRWTKPVLKGIFSIPAVIVLMVIMMAFLIWRNYHLLQLLFQ